MYKESMESGMAERFVCILYSKPAPPILIFKL